MDVVTYWPMWNPAWMKSELSHKDSATRENGCCCLSNRGMDDLHRFVTHQGPQVRWTGGSVGHFTLLGWLRPRWIVCSILTLGHASWGGRSTIGTDWALCTSRTRGLQRFQSGLLSSRTRGVVHLQELAADWDTLYRWGRVDILRYSAQRLTSYQIIGDKKYVYIFKIGVPSWSMEQDPFPQTRWRSQSRCFGHRFIDLNLAWRLHGGFIFGTRVGGCFPLASPSLRCASTAFSGGVINGITARRTGRDRDSWNRYVTFEVRDGWNETI
jgi:hypothetical protein